MFSWCAQCHFTGSWYVLSPFRKETNSEGCQGRTRINNIETRAAIKFFFLQGKAPKEIQAILRETLACFLPGRAKDLSAPLYIYRMIRCYTYNFGDRGSTVVKVLYYKSEDRWFDPKWCQWIFQWHKILSIALWPLGRLSLQQKWVPEVFPGGKGGRCVGLKT